MEEYRGVRCRLVVSFSGSSVLGDTDEERNQLKDWWRTGWRMTYGVGSGVFCGGILTDVGGFTGPEEVSVNAGIHLQHIQVLPC